MQWWPLAPGAMLTLVGAAILVGDPARSALPFLNVLWPLAIIAFGLYLLFRRRPTSQP